MSLSVKRLMRDYKYVKNENLEEQGLYCIMNEENIYEIKAMVVGPKDTPYEGGFYFFLLKFSKEYPHKPPSITFHTLDNRVRFNPNYYKCGKVCLSILGTWDGPKWTVCMTLTTVLCSIQSLMSEMPYRNEPGHDNDSVDKCTEYNKCITYHNFRISIINMLEKPTPGYEEFLPIMEKIFVKDYPMHKKLITKLRKKMQGKSIVAPSPFTNMKADCDYSTLEKKMDNLYNKLSPIYGAEISNENDKETNKQDKDDKPQMSNLMKKILAQKTALFG